MTTISDLVRLGQLYPPGSLDDPVYAFAGGTAVQCWLHHSTNDREHEDIDLFTFKPSFLKSIMGVDFRQTSFFLGGLTQEGIVAYSPAVPLQLQITRGSYFDSEISPTIEDVREVTIDETALLALSPEFIAVSKLSYPNVIRSCDFQDVLALNQSGCLQSAEYLSALLAQTSLGKLINAQDILGLNTHDDLQALMDSIHRQLIRRFLYWDRVNVDALNPFQFFVLLDMGDELFHLPADTYQFIDTMIARTTLEGRNLQIAKLGLHFLTVGIPNQSLSVLQDSEFQALVRRGLALIPEQRTVWLSRCKIVFTTLRQLTRIEDFANRQFDSIWSPASLIKIVQRILFDDPSRFTLMTSVKSLYHDLETGQVSVSDCANLLHNLLAIPKQ